MASAKFLPNLSQRERKMALWTLIIAAVVVLYVVVIAPFLEYRTSLLDADDQATTQLAKAKRLIEQQPILKKQWAAFDLKPDLTDASSQILHAIEDWARQSGMDLTTQKPNQSMPDAKDDRFMQMNFQVEGAGSTAEVSRFIYLVEKSKLPARIINVHIRSRGREGTDDLSMDMIISTIFLAPPKPPKHNGAVASAYWGDRFAEGSGR